MSFNHANRDSDGSSHGVVLKANESAFERIEIVPEYAPGDVEDLESGRKNVTIVDPVFGEIYDGGPNYRNVQLP
jgi:hypothetical protein